MATGVDILMGHKPGPTHLSNTTLFRTQYNRPHQLFGIDWIPNRIYLDDGVML